MKYSRYLLVFALLLVIPTAAFAQQRFEFAPSVGWRHGNDISDVSGIAVNLDSGVTYGFTVDVTIYNNLQAEFIYSYRDGPGNVFIPPGLPDAGDNPSGRFDIAGKQVYYQGGILYNFELMDPNLKPFIVGTLGAANFNSGGQSSTNFSLSAGAGIKYFFTKNIGFRGEYRLFSTSTNFLGVGGWCDWWGWCYTVLTTKYLYQSQFAASVIIGF